jgi:hypothetical protein
MISLLTITWALATVVVFYSIFAELSITLSNGESRQTHLFFDCNQRIAYILLALALLLVPFLCSVILNLSYGYPIFKISLINGGFEKVSYFSFPVSCVALAMVSQVSKIESKASVFISKIGRPFSLITSVSVVKITATFLLLKSKINLIQGIEQTILGYIE